MKRRLAILATVAILALTPQAHASALIANCKLKPNANVYTMPSSGDDHLFSQAPKEIAVEVYDQYGGQWAYIETEEKIDPGIIPGWVLRSSLTKCENIKPWKKQ